MGVLFAEMSAIVRDHKVLDKKAMFPLVKELFVRSLPPLYTHNLNLHYCDSYKALGNIAECIYLYA